MAIPLKSVDDLQEHLLGVFQRSDHHAGEVNEVLLAIAGGILWRKNPGDHVRVNEKEGAGGNVIWFRIGEQRFALLYNHRARRIELLIGGRRGQLVQSFTNATPLAEVSRVFSTLGMTEEEAAAYLAERAEIKAQFPKGAKGKVKQAVLAERALAETTAAADGSAPAPARAGGKRKKRAVAGADAAADTLLAASPDAADAGDLKVARPRRGKKAALEVEALQVA
ncbi:hypothetical protein AACH06_26455 [Ideonella sp. DXS29W]|uniref:Integron cassette protein VCH-CASS1 chain domain-containing protein n=1 Tax=Ideonella lacteola TaxID=2984193 RepID=A0ABU9C0M5_9BURK